MRNISGVVTRGIDCSCDSTSSTTWMRDRIQNGSVQASGGGCDSTTEWRKKTCESFHKAETRIRIKNRSSTLLWETFLYRVQARKARLRKRGEKRIDVLPRGTMIHTHTYTNFFFSRAHARYHLLGYKAYDIARRTRAISYLWRSLTAACFAMWLLHRSPRRLLGDTACSPICHCQLEKYKFFRAFLCAVAVARARGISRFGDISNDSLERISGKLSRTGGGCKN